MKILTGHYVYTAPFNIFALFARNFEQLGVLINAHPNAPNSKPSKIDPVVAYIPEKRYRDLHPQEKVQGPTSLRKGTGAYIPTKRFRGLHPHEKVQGPTSPKKVQKPNPRKCKGVYIPRKRYRGLRAQKRYGSQVPRKCKGAYIPRKRYTGVYFPRKWRDS